MRNLALAYGLARFAFRLRSFCATPIDTATAEATIRQRLASRGVAVLHLVERLLRDPRSPYGVLFRAAGCELGDVHALVARDGVEGALRTLAEAGVYVASDEFKGRAPIVRGGETARVSDRDFDNPLIPGDFSSTTGGTHGRPRRILIDLDYLADMAPGWAVWFAAHDWLARPLVFVTPTYPGVVGRQLRCVRFGKPYDAWFSTGNGMSVGYRVVSAYLNQLVRWRTGVPATVHVGLGDLGPVARRLAELTTPGPRRVSSRRRAPPRGSWRSAEAQGRPLAGVCFLLGGEPVTLARRRAIEASGARAFATYGTSEMGSIGVQCALSEETDGVHLFQDGVAVVSRARRLASGETVDALLVTAFPPTCPKLMLNVEIGDYGTLEDRACGCRLGELGYGRHLHSIRSFEKLTGEGATIHVADLHRVLEEVLPRRFGGTSTDYQLLEEQTSGGLPRYVFLVSPEVGAIDERALVRVFLEEVGRLRRPYPFMLDQWTQGDAIRVRRERPRPTGRGKLASFRTLGPDDHA